ncbi:MAG: TAT-variant-translocated molybdopterin oxidoreductase [Tepidisphaeraceae bacterium]
MNDKQSNGRTYWQSLNQLAETPALQAAIENEFSGYDPQKMVNQSRRKFLKLAGASMALAGITVTGCRRWPKENVVEQVSRPIGRIPGVPEQYATLMELGGFAQPLLVSSYDGRPIKVEGNPLHPACATFGGKLGSSSLIAQASLLDMYDPERSRSTVQRQGNIRQPVAFKTFTDAMAGLFAAQKGQGGKTAVLIEETRSPSVAAALAGFQKVYPQAKVYSYEPISRDNELLAAKAAFGTPARQVFDLKTAQVVLSFDADLLGEHPNALRQINDWAQGRKSVDTTKTMNRLYVIESRYTLTGSVADHRLPASTRDIEQLILQLAYKAGLESAQAGLEAGPRDFIDKVWEDLTKNPGKALIAGGYNLRPEVLGVIAAINEKLGAFGATISLIPETDRPTHAESIKALVDSMKAGNVDTLVILGGNPAYDAPADLGFGDALGKVANSIHLSLYDNETSQLCLWHVNRAHYLESWGDAEFYDGTIGVQQPIIEPLFNGKTVVELLAILSGESVTNSQDLLYRTWGSRLNEKFLATSAAFQKILHDGFVGEKPKAVAVKGVSKPSIGFGSAEKGFELRFVADSKVYDGRFANNGWLQECPDTISKITWDNAALISYADAKELGVTVHSVDQDVLQITLGNKSLKIPCYVVPGQPKGVITLPLGYARQKAGNAVLSERFGSIGQGVGYDTYSLRSSNTLWSATGAQVKITGERADLACTQGQHIIEPYGYQVREERVGEKSQGGLVVHESTLAAYLKNPNAPHGKSEKALPLQLYPGPYVTGARREAGPDAFNNPHAWGMAIDMSTCVGCNACVVACQAENNIPVVGKDEVIVNRNMHWLRIDRYYKGAIDDPNPEITYQPMMCVHCENAPCEEVCPVAATVHDSEGLNTMVYNRCIGTRYCANNCPYKVRRFNYLDYQSRVPGEWRKPWLGIPDTQQEESVDKIKALVFNPEVTVRMRGVMEKCSYCAQRIKLTENTRRIEWLDGKRAQPTVDDFDVVTACQQACPAEAIVFGNLNDGQALVSKLQATPRSYQVLQELNNRPRGHHLATIRNPAFEEAGAEASEHEA